MFSVTIILGVENTKRFHNYHHRRRQVHWLVEKFPGVACCRRPIRDCSDVIQGLKNYAGVNY